jgi:DNA-binding ferritin-like protein
MLPECCIITRDEYTDMRQSYENEISSLQKQKDSISEQQEHYSNCIEDMTKITRALRELIDFTDESVKKKFLDKFLVSIVPDQDTYYWNYRLIMRMAICVRRQYLRRLQSSSV